MIVQARRFRSALGFLIVLQLSPIAAAAPKIDTIFPAGGQRGTSVEITISGTFDSWPVQTWASHPGIVISLGKKSGQATVAIAPDVPCGVHWVRLYDKTGA